MANAHFLRQLQHLSTPILAVSACNGSPELASLLSLRAALILVLRSSRFYSRLLPAIAADEAVGDEPDEEIGRMAREGRVGFLRDVRQRQRVRCSWRSFGATALPEPRCGGVSGSGSGFGDEWHEPWTLRQFDGLHVSSVFDQPLCQR